MDANARPQALGWPWDAMLAAAKRWEAADRAMMVAGTAGDVMAKAAAELDREEAMTAFREVREEIVRQWLLGFRLALEMEPTAVRELLGALPPTETVTEAIGELEDRVDAAAGGVKRVSGETWRLANVIAGLIQGEPTTERTTDAPANRETCEAVTPGTSGGDAGGGGEGEQQAAG